MMETERFRNVVHGSDSPDNGKREIGKFCNNSVWLYMLLLGDFLNQWSFKTIGKV